MFLGWFNIPTLCTFLGLCFSFSSVICAFHGLVPWAIVCLMASGLCDLFDGLIARRTKLTDQERAYGLQIDSIVDMASFGVAPMVLLMFLGLGTVADGIFMMAYVCAAAMRLAYFNVHGTQQAGAYKSTMGLPVTYAALIFPLVLTLGVWLDPRALRLALRLTIGLLALLFVLKIRIPKPQGIFYILFPVMFAGLTIFWLLRA